MIYKNINLLTKELSVDSYSVDLKYQKFTIKSNVTLIKNKVRLIDVQRAIGLKNIIVNENRFSIEELEKKLNLKAVLDLSSLNLYISDLKNITPKLKLLSLKSKKLKIQLNHSVEYNSKIKKSEPIVLLRSVISNNITIKNQTSNYTSLTNTISTNIYNTDMVYSNYYVKNNSTKYDHFKMSKSIINEKFNLNIGDIYVRKDKFSMENLLRGRGLSLDSKRKINTQSQEFQEINIKVPAKSILEIKVNNELVLRRPSLTIDEIFKSYIPIYPGYNNIQLDLINEYGDKKTSYLKKYILRKNQIPSFKSNLFYLEDRDPESKISSQMGMAISLPISFFNIGLRSEIVKRKKESTRMVIGSNFKSTIKSINYGLSYLELKDGKKKVGNAKSFYINSQTNNLYLSIEHYSLFHFNSLYFEKKQKTNDIVNLRYKRLSYTYDSQTFEDKSRNSKYSRFNLYFDSSLSTRIEYNHKNKQVDGLLNYTYVYRKFSFGSNFIYTSKYFIFDYSTIRLSNLELARSVVLNLSSTYHPNSDLLSINGGLVFQNTAFQLGAFINHSINDAFKNTYYSDTSIYLNLSTGLDISSGQKTSSIIPERSYRLKVLAYVDENDNKERDLNEKIVSGLKLKVNGQSCVVTKDYCYFDIPNQDAHLSYYNLRNIFLKSKLDYYIFKLDRARLNSFEIIFTEQGSIFGSVKDEKLEFVELFDSNMKKIKNISVMSQGIFFDNNIKLGSYFLKYGKKVKKVKITKKIHQISLFLK